MNCPYCKSIVLEIVESCGLKVPVYECGSHWDLQEFYRTSRCHEKEETEKEYYPDYQI